jgi:ABC-type glycerol-3-phosphate transport system substrate-binding protein
MKHFAALLIAALLLLAGCAEPDTEAELKSARKFCLAQHSQVKSVHFWTGEGEGFKVICKDGATAE